MLLTQRVLKTIGPQFKRLFSIKPSDAVIVAAVRTPIGSFRGKLAPLSRRQMLDLTVEETVKRAAMPWQEIQAVYVGSVHAAAEEQAPALRAMVGLSSLARSTRSTAAAGKPCSSGFEAILLSAYEIATGAAHVALATAVESISNVPDYKPQFAKTCDKPSDSAEKVNSDEWVQSVMEKWCISPEMITEYTERCKARLSEAWSAGAFDEVVPVSIRMENTTESIVVESDEEGYGVDGAAALMLTSAEKADCLDLKPLARILDYKTVLANPSGSFTTLAKAAASLFERSEIVKGNVAMWEIHAASSAVPLCFISEMQLDPTKVNVHGGFLNLQHADGISLSGACSVTHLAHKLEPGQFGFAAVCNTAGDASVMLMEKLANPSDKIKPPVLTLYTKDPCPLCDAMVEQLEARFAGQYRLEKVFIDQPENLRFMRLFRFDIPVLFLNGEFLCMHRLNEDLLRRKFERL